MNMTIGDAARATGVPEHTLRAWERRYDLFKPIRGTSGYRLYDHAALTTIRAMQSLVSAGWAPSAAADELSRRPRVVASLAATAGTMPDPVAPLVHAAAEFDAAAESCERCAMRCHASAHCRTLAAYLAQLSPPLRAQDQLLASRCRRAPCGCHMCSHNA